MILICYIVLWQYEVNSDSKHGYFNAQHFFGCVTRDKAAWNWRSSPVKHINVIKDKFHYGFKC